MTILPGTADSKFLLYTLACREFLKRLGDIRIAVEGNQHLDCIAHFDNSVTQFFKDDFKEVNEALEQFELRFHAETNYLRRSNAQLAQIFDQFMISLYTKLPLWSYHSDIDSLHILGRKLARLFFEASPWRETQERLHRSCHVEVEFDISEPPKPLIAYRSGHHYVDCTEQCAGSIVTRFSFKHTFDTYLAYPFLFLHEYTAHVYAIDNQKNPRFNDGWMIHAAARFLERQLLNTSSNIPELDTEQTDIFYAIGMIATLDKNAQNAYNIAAKFDTLVSGLFPSKFRDITYELAAFSQGTAEELTWPSKFINTINLHLRNPASLVELLRKTGQATSARDLIQTLQSSKS